VDNRTGYFMRFCTCGLEGFQQGHVSDHLRRIREHMALETRALLLEAERARLFDHNTNRGSEAEHSIIRWLRSRFAPAYTISSGEIIDSFDTNSDLKSRQQDGILHRNEPEANRFLLPSGMRLVPIETVAAVVEVKLTLTKAEFENADKAAAETARLRLRAHRSGRVLQKGDAGSKSFTLLTDERVTAGLPIADELFGEPPTVFTLFAFGGVEKLDTIREWMEHSTIAVVCCLSAGCIVRGGHMCVGEFNVGSPDGGIEVAAEDALWHFAETLSDISKRHSLVLDELCPDFNGYAPYSKTLHVTTKLESVQNGSSIAGEKGGEDKG
jgi:Domain of unknown function (DUF6602)